MRCWRRSGDAYPKGAERTVFITPATSVNLNTTTLSLYSNTEPNTATLTATVLPENTTGRGGLDEQ